MNPYETGQSESVPPPISEETIEKVENDWQENGLWSLPKMRNITEDKWYDIHSQNPTITGMFDEIGRELIYPFVDDLCTGFVLGLDAHNANNRHLLIDNLSKLDESKISNLGEFLRRGLQGKKNILQRVKSAPQISDILLSRLANNVSTAPLSRHHFLLGVTTAEELVGKNWDVIKPTKQS